MTTRSGRKQTSAVSDADRRVRVETAVACRRKRRGWTPFRGPQIAAYKAVGLVDQIGYGGAGGGGKTDLGIGVAYLKSRRAVIYRRTNPQLAGVEERARTVYRGRGTYNETRRFWRLTRRCDAAGRPAKPVKVFVQFGSMHRLEDREKWRGIPFDTRIFDEAQNFLREQVQFVMAWTRTEVEGQPVCDIFTFNPPTDPAGLWLIDYFGPWIDPKNPEPLRPGEVAWYIMLPDGTEKRVPGPTDYTAPDFARPAPVVIPGKDGKPDRALIPRSRTFFPALCTDNPVYMQTGYMTVLDNLPEPLRSQMRDGDFSAGMKDDAWQVIPTAWVQAAMERGRKTARPTDADGAALPFDSAGVDVACGGDDSTAIAPGVGDWYADLQVYQGEDTDDGAKAAGLVIVALEGADPKKVRLNIDVIGVGQGLRTAFTMMEVPFNAINAADGSDATDRSGLLQMFNLRAEIWWSFREALDPASGRNISLPDDRALLTELCSARWSNTAAGVKIEPNDKIVKRIGRSPDRAVAVLLRNYVAATAQWGESPFARRKK